jgi:hypothetical protein
VCSTRRAEGDVHDLDGESSPWRALPVVLPETWTLEIGGSIGLSVLAVDSGFATQTVYCWCRRFPSSRAVAIKGSDTASTLIGRPKKLDDARQDGRVTRHGVSLWTLGSSIAIGWTRQEPAKPIEHASNGWVHGPRVRRRILQAAYGPSSS